MMITIYNMTLNNNFQNVAIIDLICYQLCIAANVGTYSGFLILKLFIQLSTWLFVISSCPAILIDWRRLSRLSFYCNAERVGEFASKDCITNKFPAFSFTLFPLGELNFNIIAVGSGVMREVILNNTSKCPFTYEIVVPEQYRVAVNPNAQMPKVGKDNK